MARGDLTDEEWAVLEGLLPPERGRKARPSHDNRRFLNGMLHVLRVGCPWRDMHERYGKWKSVHARFTRWAKAGVWEKVFEDLIKDRRNEYLMLDSTLVRAHQQATTGRGSGSKKGAPIRLWGVPEAD